MKLFALVDCNNFYASCETVFNPSLRGKPLVVLSNNDGCVISRSPEAKRMGIKMGQPFFEIKKLVEDGKLFALSANFTLYGDLSRRVMETLFSISPKVEVYSIDEAFLYLEGLPVTDYEKYGKFIKEKVYRWTGIPVAVGIAPTKTLAKAATYIAKRESEEGVIYIAPGEDFSTYLKKLPVEDVWGIGRNYSKFLKSKGIKTAYDFTLIPEDWVGRYMKINGLRTLLELRGKPAIPAETGGNRHSFITSRTFGTPVEKFEDLWSAVSTFVSLAGERMREEEYYATSISVFISGGTFSNPFFMQESEILSSPTDFTPELIDAARRILERIFKKGKEYKKAGILLGGLIMKKNFQFELFTPTEVVRKKESLMEAVDRINTRYGKDAVYFASSKISFRWHSVQKKLSRKFTTSWAELPVVKG